MTNSFGENFQPPVLFSDGTPSCPRCGAALSYVQTAVVRSEYSVNEVELDLSQPGAVFVMPTANPDPDRVEDLEFLSAWIECAGLECGYRVSGEPLGEIDWVKTD